MLEAFRADFTRKYNQALYYIAMPERSITDYLIIQVARPTVYYICATKIDQAPQIDGNRLTYTAKGKTCSTENMRLPSAGQSQKIDASPYVLYNFGLEGLARYEVIELSHLGAESLQLIDHFERRGIIAKVVLTIVYAVFFWMIIPKRYISTPR